MAKKAIKPNIVRGGIGIPVPGKTNYYYMKGRKHKDGGIDIGSNPRTGLEVEDGEVIHLTDNNIKVFSSVPFLNGQSPAEKVLDGENPNKVFKQQEDFKDRNKLNDDGTKKAEFGKKVKNILIKGAQLASEASRDVRTGTASSYVKELIDKGKHEEAKQFAKNYFKANTLGISLGGGAASNKLITDLLIDAGTSAADTGINFITEDNKTATRNFINDIILNISGNILGNRIGKILNTGAKHINRYVNKKPNINKNTFNEIDISLPEIPKYAFERKKSPLEDIQEHIRIQQYNKEQRYNEELESIINNSKIKNILNRKDIGKYRIPNRTSVSKQLDYDKIRNLLYTKGVDADILSNENIDKIIGARFKDYTENINNKFALRNSILTRDGSFMYEYRQFRPEGEIGYGYIYPDKDLGNKVGMVENITTGSNKVKGVGEQMYNSVIGDLGHTINGEYLLDAEKTMRTLSKYPNKTIIGNNGTHLYNPSSRIGNIFKLTEPTYNVPVKYLDEFDLNGILPNGKFDVNFNKGAKYFLGGNNKNNTTKSKYSKKALIGGEEEYSVPTREEYIAQQLKEMRNSALEKSRTRTLPKSPLIPNEESEEEYNIKRKTFIENINILQKRVKDLEQQKALGMFVDKQLDNTKKNIKTYQDWLAKPYEKYKKGASCIYTATDNYGNDYLVSGNQSFASNPAKYGFKKIKRTNIQPGDLVQDVSQGYPSHAMIYNGKNEFGVDTFNYSRGGDSEGDIVKGGTYKQNVPLDVFRFVGTAKDSARFNMDYDKLYNKKVMGGKLNKPVTVTVNGKTKVVYSPSTGGTRSEAEGNRKKALLGDEELFIPTINNDFIIPITSSIVNRKSPYYKAPSLLPKIESKITAPITVQNKPTINPIIKTETKSNIIDKIKDFTTNNKNLVNDGLSLVGNIAGSLLSNRANRKMLNSLEYGPAPISLQPTKLKTRININPQLDKMRETLERYNSNVDANTASSRVALARKNRAAGEILGQYNSLLGDKENKETQLINQDRLNRQNITNQNIANYNTYLTNKANFENKVRELKGENKVNLINNINSAIQNTISTGEKRRRDKNSLIAIIAANPNVNPQMLKDLGFDGLSQKDIDLINKRRKINK